jgi:hypothetical protein
MQTSQLDKIVRQKDLELLKAVEHFSRNETAIGVKLLQQQGRVTEIEDRDQRFQAIAKDYAASPENTIIVSPDNASRRQINQVVRAELQRLGRLDKEEHSVRLLVPRSDLTGADRGWAGRYQVGDILHYGRGSRELKIDGGTYARVVARDPTANLLVVETEGGEHATYDPSRLRGITAYRAVGSPFAIGDRIQFTAPNRALGIANRDLGTLRQIGEDGTMTVYMDGSKVKIVTFDPREMRHFDHGYTITSHSSQGLTAERVLINIDTSTHSELINSRFAYVSVSRASHDAQIYTNHSAALAEKLIRDVSKASAIDLGRAQASLGKMRPEQTTALEGPSPAEHGISL